MTPNPLVSPNTPVRCPLCEDAPTAFTGVVCSVRIRGKMEPLMVFTCDECHTLFLRARDVSEVSRWTVCEREAALIADQEEESLFEKVPQFLDAR